MNTNLTGEKKWLPVKSRTKGDCRCFGIEAFLPGCSN